MDARDLLNGMWTHGSLAVNALEERGIRVLEVQMDLLGTMKVHISGRSVKQALQDLGRCDLRRRGNDELYPYAAVWDVNPRLTVFALLASDAAQRLLLGGPDKEAPADAPAEAV